MTACIVDRGSEGTTNGYMHTATHEVGHILGWFGHSNSSSNIMYPTVTNSIILNSGDKMHLGQIYNR